MIFSKNRPYIFIMFLFGILINVSSCSQEGKQKAISGGFVNSKAFKDYLSNYTGQEDSITFSDSRLLSLIGEDAFLDAENYDYYVIYFFKGLQDSTYYIYTLKSTSQITVSSVKWFPYGYPIYLKKGEEEPMERFNINTSTKIIDGIKAKTIIQKLDEAIIRSKNQFPTNYDIDLRNVYYYNGKDYFFINDYKLEEPEMDSLDLLIRNSEIFRP